MEAFPNPGTFFPSQFLDARSGKIRYWKPEMQSTFKMLLEKPWNKESCSRVRPLRLLCRSKFSRHKNNLDAKWWNERERFPSTLERRVLHCAGRNQRGGSYQTCPTIYIRGFDISIQQAPDCFEDRRRSDRTLFIAIRSAPASANIWVILRKPWVNNTVRLLSGGHTLTKNVLQWIGGSPVLTNIY